MMSACLEITDDNELYKGNSHVLSISYRFEKLQDTFKSALTRHDIFSSNELSSQAIVELPYIVACAQVVTFMF